MSYKEKSNYISLVTTLLVSVPYFVYVYLNYQDENFSNSDSELMFWAKAILLLIPVRIVSEIIMHIIAAIITAIVTQKEEPTISDERDNLIELKGMRNSFFTFIIGFMLSMVAMVYLESITSMFVVLIAAGFLSELVSVLSMIYFYKKGV